MDAPTTLQKLPARGDIILLAGTGLSYWLNVAYQSVVRRKLARHSHVALIFSPTSVIDAMPNIGVRVRQWDDLHALYDHRKTRVFRYKLQGSLDQHLTQQFTYHYERRWSLSALLKRETAGQAPDDKTICSSFASKIYADAHVKVSARPVGRTFPVDMHTFLANSADWEEIPFQDYNIGTQRLGEMSANLSSKFDQVFSGHMQQQVRIMEGISLLSRVVARSIDGFDRVEINDPSTARLFLATIDSIAPATAAIHQWQEVFIRTDKTRHFRAEVGHENSLARTILLDATTHIYRQFDRCCEIISNHIRELGPKLNAATQALINEQHDADAAIKAFDSAHELHIYVTALLRATGLIEHETKLGIEERIEGYPALLETLQLHELNSAQDVAELVSAASGHIDAFSALDFRACLLIETRPVHEGLRELARQTMEAVAGSVDYLEDGSVLIQSDAAQHRRVAVRRDEP